MSKFIQAYVSIGSNIDPAHYLKQGWQAMQAVFGELESSPVYETEAVGFEGDHFLNAVIGLTTTLPVDELRQTLKDIENRSGRTRAGGKFSARTLDLDLLLYGDLIDAERNLPRDEITRYAFVLGPLADLIGNERHPQLQQSYAELWQTSSETLNEPTAASIEQLNA